MMTVSDLLFKTNIIKDYESVCRTEQKSMTEDGTVMYGETMEKYSENILQYQSSHWELKGFENKPISWIIAEIHWNMLQISAKE